VNLILVGSFVIRVGPFFIIRIRGMICEMIAPGEYRIEEGPVLIENENVVLEAIL